MGSLGLLCLLALMVVLNLMTVAVNESRSARVWAAFAVGVLGAAVLANVLRLMGKLP
jgi:hypothetical protein